MILLLNTTESFGEYHTVVPTIFPDKTSQVWKIPNIETMTSCFIEWRFEQEVELIWLNQLLALLDQYQVTVGELHIPYLPYARQDKQIDNNSTFAREVFLEMIGGSRNMLITSLDMHSPARQITNISPEPHIKKAVDNFQPSVIVYPDRGAYRRYSKLECLEDFPAMIMDKTRDQATGEITGLVTNFVLPNNNYPLRLLMVDDICDGGATFIRIADYITERVQNHKIGLYTTHGIYSKGKSVLYEAEITHLYTAPTLGNK